MPVVLTNKNWLSQEGRNSAGHITHEITNTQNLKVTKECVQNTRHFGEYFKHFSQALYFASACVIGVADDHDWILIRICMYIYQ